MNRKRIIILSVIVMCIAVVILGISRNRINVVYGLSEGTYTVESAEDAIIPASITFDLDEDTFSFNYNLLSSYLPNGTWKVEHGKVIATTDDKNHVYIFEILDNDTLKFIQKGSSTVTYIDKRINSNPQIIDGTKFIFSVP